MPRSAAEVQGLVAHFRRSTTNDEAEIVRPPGETFPIAAYIRWRTPGPGRDVLNEFLEGVTLFELAELVRAVIDRELFELPALQELGERDRWSLSTVSDGLRLERGADDRVGVVDRTEMLLALELLARVALEPFAAVEGAPAWAARARAVYPRLLSALGGTQRFEPADDSVR
jgi:hypothetical protein